MVEDSDAGWGFLRPTTIAATTSSATSYRLSVDIDPSVAAGVPPSNDKVGLVFGWSNAGNYYRVEWTDFGSNWQSRSTYRDLQIVRVQNGTESILANPSHSYTQSLLASVPGSQAAGIPRQERPNA